MDASSVNTDEDGYTDGDEIRILLATDCHLGYEEDDPVIGDDSFRTFEEILKLAAPQNVDMILLGGDLFDSNRPSQKAMNKCMSLLRKYTMGNKDIYLEFLSDGSENFKHCVNPVVNYHDENFNVAVPVFSIHGNHDDPSGKEQCSALDTLSSAGLVNYFGKWTDLTQIKVHPLLFRKGKTQLALYGLSYIKDDRLARLFIQEKVSFPQLKDQKQNWFNILTLHQNRADRGLKKYVNVRFLPDFLDLIVWGHEHDCRITPEKVEEKNFYITQPGSSVPTSLAEGESIPKHVAILRIRGKKFKMEPIKLLTTRPFLFDHINLQRIDLDYDNSRKMKSELVEEYCYNKVEAMIKESESNEYRTGHSKQPKLPLIRLRVEFKDETEQFNKIRFGQKFLNRVANPNLDVVLFKKTIAYRKKENYSETKSELENLKEQYEEEGKSFVEHFQGFVDQYFQLNNRKMLVLSASGMSRAVESFVEKDQANSIQAISKAQFDNTKTKLAGLDVNEENITMEMERLREERELRKADFDKEMETLFRQKLNLPQTETNNVTYNSDDDGEVTLVDEVEPPVRGRGRGRGRARGTAAAKSPRGARGGRGSRGGRGGKNAAEQLSMNSFLTASQPRTPQRVTRVSTQRGASSKIQYNIESDSD